MSATPLHDWLAPRLATLVRDADSAGFPLDAVVAVLTDLLNGPALNRAAPGKEDADLRDPGEPSPPATGGTASTGQVPPIEPHRAETHLRHGSRW